MYLIFIGRYCSSYFCFTSLFWSLFFQGTVLLAFCTLKSLVMVTHNERNLEAVRRQRGSSPVNWKEMYPITYPLRNAVQHSIYCNSEKDRSVEQCCSTGTQMTCCFPFVLYWLMVLSCTGLVHLYWCSISNSVQCQCKCAGTKQQNASEKAKIM